MAQKMQLMYKPRMNLNYFNDQIENKIEKIKKLDALPPVKLTPGTQPVPKMTIDYPIEKPNYFEKVSTKDGKQVVRKSAKLNMGNI